MFSYQKATKKKLILFVLSFHEKGITWCFILTPKALHLQKMDDAKNRFLFPPLNESKHLFNKVGQCSLALRYN